jgi:hypothetical protein
MRAGATVGNTDFDKKVGQPRGQQHQGDYSGQNKESGEHGSEKRTNQENEPNKNVPGETRPNQPGKR